MSSLNVSPTQLLTPLQTNQTNALHSLSDAEAQMRQALEILNRNWDCVDLMPFRTAFIITDTDGLENYLDATQWADTGMSLLASQSGGSMSFNGQGKYMSNSQNLISETIHLVECFYPSFDAQIRALPLISRFLKELQCQRHQESIAIKFNSALLLLS